MLYLCQIRGECRACPLREMPRSWNEVLKPGILTLWEGPLGWVAAWQTGKPYLQWGILRFFPRICSKVELEFINKMGWKNDENMFQEGGPTKPEVHYFVQALFVQSVPPPMPQPKRKPQTSVDHGGSAWPHSLPYFFKAIKQYIIQHHTVYIVYVYIPCTWSFLLIWFFSSCFF